jgi:hypothetical protein
MRTLVDHAPSNLGQIADTEERVERNPVTSTTTKSRVSSCVTVNDGVRIPLSPPVNLSVCYSCGPVKVS